MALASHVIQAKSAKMVKEFNVQSILSDVLPGSKRYQKNTMLAQTASFVKTSGFANIIEAVDLTYFDSNDCSGTPSTNGTRQTITGGSFAIWVC